MTKLSSIFRISYRFVSANSFRWNQAVSKTAVVEGDPKFAECVEFPEQVARIETCGKLYEECRKKYYFKKFPEGNLTFDVRYVDTHSTESEDVKNDAPVVVMMHGAPGSYDDFRIMTSFLFRRGLRVVAPSFPDFSIFPPGIFRHSIDEKMQYIKDFLSTIGIVHVDLLVCHSSSVYPGLKLSVENHQPSVSSLVLLNPGAYSTNMKCLRFFPCLKLMVWLSERPAGLDFLKSVGPTILKTINVPVRVDNMLDPLLSTTAMVYADIPKAREHLHELSVRKFPIFLAFSENDKMIEKEHSYRIAYKLLSQDEDICYIAENGTVSKKGRIVNNVQAMAFEKGSHYVFLKYPEIINEAIYSFLQKYVV